MRLRSQVRNFLIDKDFYIDIYEENIHIFHYVDVLKLEEQEIELQMDGFVITLQGENFRVKGLEKEEILITGKLENLTIKR